DDLAGLVAGQVGAESAAPGIRVDLPVPRRCLGVAGDQDVEVALAVQLRPALDRQRRRAVALVAAERQRRHGGVERLAELAVGEVDGGSPKRKQGFLGCGLGLGSEEGGEEETGRQGHGGSPEAAQDATLLETRGAVNRRRDTPRRTIAESRTAPSPPRA